MRELDGPILLALSSLLSAQSVGRTLRQLVLHSLNVLRASRWQKGGDDVDQALTPLRVVSVQFAGAPIAQLREIIVGDLPWVEFGERLVGEGNEREEVAWLRAGNRRSRFVMDEQLDLMLHGLDGEASALPLRPFRRLQRWSDFDKSHGGER